MIVSLAMLPLGAQAAKPEMPGKHSEETVSKSDEAKAGKDEAKKKAEKEKARKSEKWRASFTASENKRAAGKIRRLFCVTARAPMDQRLSPKRIFLTFRFFRGEGAMPMRGSRDLASCTRRRASRSNVSAFSGR